MSSVCRCGWLNNPVSNPIFRRHPTFKLLEAPIGRVGEVGVRRCGQSGKVSRPPLRMANRLGFRLERLPTAAVAEGRSFRGAAVRKGWNTRRAAVAEGRSFRGANSAEDRKVREPIRRRKEWERSRRCGWEIEVGADVAAGRSKWEPIQRLRGWFQEPISTVSQ